MKITLQRTILTPRSTTGVLTIPETAHNDRLTVFTLEDGRREHKIYGETRIPAGIYNLDLRTAGGWHERMAARYEFHRGMIWLRNVPLFEWIYIHPGNSPADTLGCILVGLTHDEDWIGSSRAAYERIYPPIAGAILAGPCQIEILDEEHDQETGTGAPQIV